MISTDRKLFEENSAVKRRVVEYGKLVEDLHIIVFNKDFRFEKRLIGNNISVYPTNSKNKLFYIFDAIKIGRKIVENWKSKVEDSSNKNNILVTCQDPFETGFVGWVIAKSKKTKLHLQVHTDFLTLDFQTTSVLNKIRSQLAMFLIIQADGVRVVSERIKKSILSWKLKKEEKLSVLPIFVDIEKIKNTEIRFDLHKKYLQFDFIIFTASRFEKEKNLLMMIDIMKEVVKKYPKIGLVVVGEGSQKDILNKKIYKEKMQNNIFVDNWQKDLISYYKTSDLFLFTSNYEGYGMVLLESAVAGCPILTTNVGLVGSVLKEGSVEVCTRKNKRCFIKKILNLVENKNLLEEMTIKAKQDVENNVMKTKEEYLSAYKKDWERCFG